jgi:hypothetical protein
VRRLSHGENYISPQVKSEAQTSKRDPCAILAEMLAKARSVGDTKLAAEIVKAQKYLGWV